MPNNNLFLNTQLIYLVESGFSEVGSALRQKVGHSLSVYFNQP